MKLIAIRILLLLLFTFLGLAIGFVLGLAKSHAEKWNSQYNDEVNIVSSILSESPNYSGIKILPYSEGGIVLSGEIATTHEYDSLKSQLVTHFGTRTANRMMQHFKQKTP